MCAYSRAAGAIVERFPSSETICADAWSVAGHAMLGVHAAGERLVCIQQLLPMLVASTPRMEAAARIAEMVNSLWGCTGDDGLPANGSSVPVAATREALSLATAFSPLLLDHWQLSSLQGSHCKTGQALIADGLRRGPKELASLRKQARFLLESAVQQALVAQGAEARFQEAAGVSLSAVSAAWRCYWELFDTLDDYSSHLLKSSWDALITRLMKFLAGLKRKDASAYPPAVPGPAWLEIFLVRALDHDNDSVHKFVLGQLMSLDQGTACLSEAFILGEILPRFGNGIDSLYPKHDVERLFERQVTSFFVGFIGRHECGSVVAARRLLEALLQIPAVHFTPVRLVLSLLLEVDFSGNEMLEAEVALALAEPFLSSHLLLRMPVSVRPRLVVLFFRVLVLLCDNDKRHVVNVPAAIAPRLAGVAALIPDALLADVRELLRSLADACLGEPAPSLLAQLLQSLASASQGGYISGKASADDLLPMEAIKQVFGTVRLLWAFAGDVSSNQASKLSFSDLAWPALSPTLQELHRRTYLPRRAAVSALFACTYASSLQPEAEQLVVNHTESCSEMLAYVHAKALLALGHGQADDVVQEAPWVWLYALVFERFWQPTLPHGNAVMKAAKEVLNKRSRAGQDSDSVPNGVGESPSAVLSQVTAVALLGALAPKVEASGERCELFLLLWQAQAPAKPSGVVDSRFSIGQQSDLGVWKRSRLEEYEDLHRHQREGLGRVQEWRDAPAVFLMAKWRALWQLVSKSGDFLSDLSKFVSSNSSRNDALTLTGLSADLLSELDSLQPPHVAFWAVVARRVAFPVFFGEGESFPREKQQETLSMLCKGLSGSISQSVGEGSVFMPRGCLLELAAALCHPLLRAAELRLFSGETGPLTAAVKNLLALGENGTSVSRCVAVPLLTCLIAEHGRDGGVRSTDAVSSAAELLTLLLTHSEYTVKDGAFVHTVLPCAGFIDADSPGGPAALDAACPSARKLCDKFTGTEGLPRILSLAALDGFTQHSRQHGFPPVVREVLVRLLAALRKELDVLVKRHAGGGNKPLTPMPLSPLHRLQLRGWQAVMVLGCHADRTTAEMLLPELFWHLRTPHLPDVRDYQELLCCVLCSRFQDLAVEPLMVPTLKEYDSNAQVSASLLVITAFLCKSWAAAMVEQGERLRLPSQAAALIKAAVPYLGHNSAYVRGMAAWGFAELLGAIKAAGALEELSVPGRDNEESLILLSELHAFLSNNRECQKMRRRLRPVFQGFETETKTALEALTQLSEVMPRETLPPTEEAQGLLKPLHLFTDSEFRPTQSFLTLLKDEVAQEMDRIFEEQQDCTQYNSLSEHWQEAQLAVLRAASAHGADTTEEAEASAQASEAAGGASGLQRKFVPPAPPCPPDDSEMGSRSAAAVAAALARSRAPLVVVASLVDKTPNLAGLCRTCEVFHCEALCLPNLKVASEQAFQSISVTAEKWLPLRGVGRGAPLKAQLLELRRRGYALVGVEQTHTSVPLDEWQFSERTAILLGAEKEGIDAELLPLMDACVEIPQQGQLRSLNVHVSGSVVIWEYVRQARSRAQRAQAAS
eukprot:TRINITY_DN92713_c0_g1_i1.p1 TRINITY_DN92713_c0_g1~~TRINITY_DN92713_c0_g1_i1.p1  ORF type:complete len:1761 (+),score=363.55 TRINITY_DN92713_c0_g1_i1:591-5285(+)